MTIVSDRFQLLGTTEYAHEREALEFVRKEFPNTDPFHARGLIDFLQPSSGRLYEIDLLVIGFAAVYVVEIKSHPGRIEGDAHGWLWTPPGRDRPRDLANPLSLTNQKAKVISSELRRHLGNLYDVPWVQPLIFLSASDLENRLTQDGKIGVVTRDQFFRAIKFAEFPGADARRFSRAINRPMMRAIKQAFDKMGLRPRKTLLQVGDYALGPVIEDGESYQDREAYNAQMEKLRYRARVYLVPEQTSVEHKQRLRRAAEREVQLLWSVRDNQNILSSHYYAPDGPLGPTLVFEDFEGAMRLDRFLGRHPDLPFDDRVEIVRQVGHALHYCHRRDVVHGGLSPEAVLVRRIDGKLETRLFNFQLGGGEDASATIHRTALVSRTAGSYQAPELITDPGAASQASDAFSLAALAYFVFTGQPPVAGTVELQQKLYRDGCLDPSAVADDLPEPVVELIREGTALATDNRFDNTAEFVELLVSNLREDQDTPPESTANVLEADTGDILAERFEVKRVLGHGASARVLHVVEGDADGRTRAFALKVSRGPEHDERLRKEGEQLKLLRHDRIVACHEILELDERTCLLLDLAGERTLQQAIAEQGSLDLDLASRYGEDLLDALKGLEDEGIFHRDIKPANLGVGSRKKLAKHLTLFDFSLLDTSLSDLETGTAPYRDPFLALRGAWDHQGDRWSAAVTLHEMLTGLRPRYGRPGQSALDPRAELHLESERFDAALRDRLIAFFTRALAKDPQERFESARQMYLAWGSCFDVRPESEPAQPARPTARPARGGPVELGQVTDEQIAQIQPSTAIRALPLSVRAHNALDRAGLTRAEELLLLADNRLSAIRGIGSKVAREILELRDRWKAKLDQTTAGPQLDAFFPEYRGQTIAVDALDLPYAVSAALADAGLRTAPSVSQAPKAQVESVLERCAVAPKVVLDALRQFSEPSNAHQTPASLGAWLDVLFPEGKKANDHERLLRLYGLLPPFEGRCDLVLQDVADHASVSRQRLQQQLAGAIERWHRQPWRDDLRSQCMGVLRGMGGAAPIELAAHALAAEIPDDLQAPEALRTAQYATLLRVAAELGENDQGERILVRRRERRRGNERSWQVWVLAGEEALWTKVKALGDLADELALREPLASSGETVRALAAVVADTSLNVDTIGPDQLLTLAAASSHAAARSSRLELYPVGMPAQRALELSTHALSARTLSDEDIIARVRARYPEAQSLPPRPELDRLVAKLDLRWESSNGRYVRSTAGPAGSIVTQSSRIRRRKTGIPNQHSTSERSIRDRDFEDSLVGVVQDRKLRVLTVNTAFMPLAVSELERVLQTRAIEVDRRLVDHMESYVTSKGGSAEVLWKADAEGPDGPHWNRLLSVARPAAQALLAELLPADGPLLLIQAGLVARYGLQEVVQGVIDACRTDNSQAVVLLNPAHSDARQDLLNGTLPISGLLPGETGWIPLAWLENAGRGSVTAH